MVKLRRVICFGPRLYERSPIGAVDVSVAVEVAGCALGIDRAAVGPGETRLKLVKVAQIHVAVRFEVAREWCGLKRFPGDIVVERLERAVGVAWRAKLPSTRGVEGVKS